MTNTISLHTHVVAVVGTAFNTTKIQAAINLAINEHNIITDDAAYASGTTAADWVVSSEESTGFIVGLTIKILNQLRNAHKSRTENVELLSVSDLVTTEMKERLLVGDEQNETAVSYWWSSENPSLDWEVYN